MRSAPKTQRGRWHVSTSAEWGILSTVERRVDLKSTKKLAVIIGIITALVVISVGTSVSVSRANPAPQDKRGQIFQAPQKPDLGKRFEKAVQKRKVSLGQFRFIVEGLRHEKQEVVELLQAFENGAFKTEKLLKRINDLRPVDGVNILTHDESYCRAFADGAWWECLTNGGDQETCRAHADQWYCNCMGGTELGGGFCLVY